MILEEIDSLLQEVEAWNSAARAPINRNDKIADVAVDVGKKAYRSTKKIKMSLGQGLAKVARKTGPVGLLLGGGLMAAKHASASK